MISNVMAPPPSARDRDGGAVGTLTGEIAQREHRVRDLVGRDESSLRRRREHRGECGIRRLSGLYGDASNRFLGHVRIQETWTYGVTRHAPALDLGRDAPCESDHG